MRGEKRRRRRTINEGWHQVEKMLSNIVKIIRRNRYCPLEHGSPFLRIDNPETRIIFAPKSELGGPTHCHCAIFYANLPSFSPKRCALRSAYQPFLVSRSIPPPKFHQNSLNLRKLETGNKLEKLQEIIISLLM